MEPAVTTSPSWKSFWTHSHGWHLDLTLKGSSENSRKDALVLVPQIAREFGAPRSFVTNDIGTVNPARALTAKDACIAAFFGKFLEHHGGQSPNGPSPRYPNIIFVR